MAKLISISKRLSAREKVNRALRLMERREALLKILIEKLRVRKTNYRRED